MPTTKGKFIVIEGLEGAGKTTAITMINDYLQARSLSNIQTREPGSTKLGEQIRNVIKNSEDNIDPYAELLLLYAARVQLLQQIIIPALAAGDWVISDRFELSTWAYQGGGRGIDYAVIEQLSAIFLHGFTPDLIFFLDITPAQGLDRVRIRGLQKDRIEMESNVFFDRVYAAYHAKIKTMSNVINIDARLPIESVQQSIVAALERL